MARTVMQVLGDTVKVHGSRPAYRASVGGRWQETSYREMERQIRRVARGLMALGVSERPRQKPAS